jgi:hypothetical protein
LVLSNAERQARFQKRLREKATQSVTVEMIDDVAAITWDRARQDDPSLPVWDDVISTTGTKRGLRAWEDHIRSIGVDIGALDAAEMQATYGRNADLVSRVAAVLRGAFVAPHKR